MRPELLRKGFGWLVLAMGVFLLGKQLPGALRDVGMPIALALVLVVAAVSLARGRAAAPGHATPLLHPPEPAENKPV